MREITSRQRTARERERERDNNKWIEGLLFKVKTQFRHWKLVNYDDETREIDNNSSYIHITFCISEFTCK